MKCTIACAASAVVAALLSVAAAVYATVPNPTGAYKYQPNRIFESSDFSSTLSGLLIGGGTLDRTRGNYLNNQGDFHMAFEYSIENPEGPLSAPAMHAQIRKFFDAASDRPIHWIDAASTISFGRYCNGDLNGVIRVFVSQVSETQIELVTECEENLWLPAYPP